MRFSFSTIYTTIITSNILFIVVACFLNSKSFLYKVGYKILGFLAVLALFRLLLPFEFPFTQTLQLPKWISFFLTKIHYALFYIGKFKVSPWVLFLIIWSGGILYQVHRFIKENRMLAQYIKCNGEDVTNSPPYASALTKIHHKSKKKISCRIIKLPGINSPMLYGLFSPCILLPQQMNFDKQELYYILNHEITHFLHHDILLKYSLRLISILYWWNPACHILRHHTDLLLEMRIDESIAQASPDSGHDYLGCLLHVAEQAIQTPSADYVNVPKSVHTLPIGFSSRNHSELTKRFQMLLQARKRSKPLTYVVITLFITLSLLLYTSSYLFIWEAGYNNPNHLEGTFTLSKENAYIVKNPDGTYDIYWNSMHIETTDSIYSYSKDIPIYNSKEDLPNEQKN